MRVQGFLRVYFQAQPILIELEYYSEIQSSLSWDNRWWFSSPSESQLLRNRWHPLSLVQWLSSSSPVCRDSLLLSLLPAALLCSLMAQRASCLLLTALILYVFSTLLCVSLCLSHNHALKETALDSFVQPLFNLKCLRWLEISCLLLHRPLATTVPRRTALLPTVSWSRQLSRIGA